MAPAWMFQAHDAILAVDIGGTNIRAGVVELNLDKKPDLSKAKVWKFELWRSRAKKEELRLAPFIGIGCPGRIDPEGAIEAGAQNLPGNWESSRFNLPATLHEAVPQIGEHETTILMHNDAVVQGLSEAPFMTDVSSWGVFTIGTGLGNALFTNRQSQ